MKKPQILNKLVLSITLAALAVMSGYEQVKGSNSKAALYAVSFHADWCGSCKILEPNVIKARGKADLDNQNVLFVKLDLTNATKRHQSELMAGALGIGDFFAKNNGKTGFVLLVDSASGKVVGKLTKDMDAGQIAKTIKKNL